MSFLPSYGPRSYREAGVGGGAGFTLVMRRFTGVGISVEGVDGIIHDIPSTMRTSKGEAAAVVVVVVILVVMV